MELCTNIKIQFNVGREKDISSSRRRFRVVGGVGHCRLANLLTHYDVPSSKNQCKIIFHVAKGCVSWLLHPFFSEYSWYLGRLWKVIDFHRHHCQWMYACMYKSDHRHHWVQWNGNGFQWYLAIGETIHPSDLLKKGPAFFSGLPPPCDNLFVDYEYSRSPFGFALILWGGSIQWKVNDV